MTVPTTDHFAIFNFLGILHSEIGFNMNFHSQLTKFAPFLSL